MPRKGAVPRRELAPDSVFNSRLVAKFINCLLRRGKKATAEVVFYNAMAQINQRTGRDPLQVFEQAMRNTMPLLEVKPRRVGGATYQVPSEVRPSRKLTMAIRWIIAGAKARAGHTMYEKLAAELMDAASGSGAAVKKREDTHRMAEANRAFAHYRW